MQASKEKTQKTVGKQSDSKNGADPNKKKNISMAKIQGNQAPESDLKECLKCMGSYINTLETNLKKYINNVVTQSVSSNIKPYLESMERRIETVIAEQLQVYINELDARKTVFQSRVENYSEPLNRVSEDEMQIFKNFRKTLEKSVKEYLGGIDDDLEYNMELSAVFKKVYEYIKDPGSQNAKKGLLDVFMLTSDEELEERLKEMKKNYAKIFKAPNIGGYPKYELIFPENNESDLSEYEKLSKQGEMDIKNFCVYPGIRERQRSAEGKEKVQYRVKPTVCVKKVK